MLQFKLAEAVNSLESIPAHVGDVLAANVGDRISLTCIHENILTVMDHQPSSGLYCRHSPSISKPYS